MKKKGFSGLSCSSKEVMLPSGPKMCFIRKWTLVFFLSKPREILSNNSSFTSSLLTWKQTQLMLWKTSPTTKEVGW